MFGVDAQTLRNWCTTFSEFLTDGARGGDGNHRRFNDIDISVLSLVHRMRGEGLGLGEAYAALKNDQRDSPPTAMEVAVREDPQKAIGFLSGRLTELQNEIVRLMDENARLKGAESKAEVLEEQLEKAKLEIKLLNREIGRLETQIEQKDKS